MLHDRPYMRSDYEHRPMPVLTWLIVAIIAGFVVQQFFTNYTARPTLMTEWFALSLGGIADGKLWQFVTYAFLHGGRASNLGNGLLHIIVNLVGIFFIGREVLRNIGPERFLVVFFGSVIVGGLAWAATAALSGSSVGLVGASAAVFALLVVFACAQPDKPVTFLLFFVIPVTLKPKHLVVGLLGASVFGLLFFEIPASHGIAHSSHLGGMLAGWIYHRYLHSRTGEFGSMRPHVELPTWLKKKKSAKTAVAPEYKVDIKRPADIRNEVDRILDKINSQGFGSLTDEERRMLDEARELLNKN